MKKLLGLPGFASGITFHSIVSSSDLQFAFKAIYLLLVIPRICAGEVGVFLKAI